MQRIQIPAVAAALFLLGFSATYADQPRLVLQITVDQLRADLPLRYYDRFTEGGFRFLYEGGVVYRNAHHAHVNTETIVGHATLATGAHPSIHGMVANLWFDRETGFPAYNVEDPNYVLLTEGADVDEDTEIDPTQASARSEGRSPAAILVTTISDEIRSSNGGKSKSIGISVKDRGAISMAGHSGTAFWFSKATGEFVTSSYYLDQYPEWVIEWNQRGKFRDYEASSWELLNPTESYLFGDSDDREWETDIAGFGRVFPHPWGNSESPYFTTLLTTSPAGDELTLSFTKAAIVGEGLGEDDVTDYLAISFSSTDYVGHLFGPSSLESEDNLLRLDRVLEDLFDYIDEHVGLDKTLIVLSGDHGGPDAPGYLNSLGIPAAYVNPAEWDTQPAIDRLKKKFRIKGDLFELYSHPYLYFSNEIKNDPKIDLAALEAAVVAELGAFPGVSLAVSSTALARGGLPRNEMYDAALRNFHPKRSGDVLVVFEANHFINDFDGLIVSSTHGSPWNYDTHVPIVFKGPGMNARTVDRRVKTVDVAATIAAILSIRAPSGSVGEPLGEVLSGGYEQ
jgi:predicted AlkP superfamily pyrophosphatase or phosphodiesterase